MGDQEESAAAGPAEEMTLSVQWAGRSFAVCAAGDDTVGELKRRICEATAVLPKRQKLLNLKAGGRPASDTALLASLGVKPALKIMMMGRTRCVGAKRDTALSPSDPPTPSPFPPPPGRRTVEDEILVDAIDTPEVLDDLALGEEAALAICHQEENQAKLRRRIAQYQIKTINPPREGKKLLVLDIDYTLFDHRSIAESSLELMRPPSYAEYDIIIWSATSMKWVQVKMTELGVLSNPSYKITALMDHLAMITVHSGSHGVFDCKPLGVIWGQFPEHYNAQNTIMFDDLRRNFVMNPKNGLVIRPFRKAHLHRHTDNELVHLTHYLLAIAPLEDLSELDHTRWEHHLGDR
eukprot:SM000047S16920  [mRNA]  locus=s47:790912:793248:- [translate_table: standard]